MLLPATQTKPPVGLMRLMTSMVMVSAGFPAVFISLLVAFAQNITIFMKLFIFSPVSTSWHSEEDNFRAPPIDRSILPTAPRSAREPNIDMSRLPRNPPYTAFLGNLPYDITEDSIKDFFRGLAVGFSRQLHVHWHCSFML